jgi:hypothetical protein
VFFQPHVQRTQYAEYPDARCSVPMRPVSSESSSSLSSSLLQETKASSDVPRAQHTPRLGTVYHDDDINEEEVHVGTRRGSSLSSSSFSSSSAAATDDPRGGLDIMSGFWPLKDRAPPVTPFVHFYEHRETRKQRQSLSSSDARIETETEMDVFVRTRIDIYIYVYMYMYICIYVCMMDSIWSPWRHDMIPNHGQSYLIVEDTKTNRLIHDCDRKHCRGYHRLYISIIIRVENDSIFGPGI